MKYSSELVNFIEQNRMKYTTLEMVKLIKKKFSKEISAKALRKYYYRHNLDYKRIYKRTDYKVWSKSIGTESNPDKNGLIRIKINQKQWQYKQRYLYEKYNNVKLKDDEYVIFLDGNKNNFKKENLTAVNKKIARTLYAITGENKLKSKELTEIGLAIAEIKMKLKEIQ